MNFKYSHAKIIDPNSEYYGQVLRVENIDLDNNEIWITHEDENIPTEYPFSQIQFCVTKDNEPVKIGEEYLCYKDQMGNDTIEHSYVQDNELVVVGVKLHYKRHFDPLSHQPLHPTNKIKITAEKIEEFKDVDKIGRFIDVSTNTDVADTRLAISQIGEKINELIRAFNRLTK